MDILDPRIDADLLPPGTRAIVIAEHQDAYQDLPSVRTPGGQIVTRWQLTEAERKALFFGDDLFITILSRGAINPFLPSVGLRDWRLSEPVPPPPGEICPDVTTLAQRAAGNLAFLLSAVRSGEQLSPDEESVIRRTIALLVGL